MPTRRDFITSAATLPFLALRNNPPQELPPAIAALPNRIHEATPITPAERQTRADKARRLMSQQNIAATLRLDPARNRRTLHRLPHL
jgi:hypothetical protein